MLYLSPQPFFFLVSVLVLNTLVISLSFRAQDRGLADAVLTVCESLQTGLVYVSPGAAERRMPKTKRPADGPHCSPHMSLANVNMFPCHLDGRRTHRLTQAHTLLQRHVKGRLQMPVVDSSIKT